MKNKPSQELIEKYLAGNATIEEKLYVEAALNQHMKGSEALRTSKEIKQASRRVKRHVFDTIDKPVLRITKNRWVPYAAAAIIVCFGFVFWKVYTSQQKLLNDKDFSRGVDAQQILPGGNRATLSFDDGTSVALDESENGIVMSDEDITYRDGSRLLKENADNRRISYATLTTPKGGTYQITLPDGSKVWLNAASSLRYPLKFDKKQRVVELEGEAFFDITSLPYQGADKHTTLIPFQVKTKRQLVEVLGTGFNVSDYEDDDETKTTLLEGSVRVLRSDAKNSTLLSPGEQAVLSKHKTTIRKVDVEQFIAWKDGFFYFDRLSPQLVLAQLARWYDIDVLYETVAPNTPIFGMIDRKKNLGSVLSSLKISGLNFKLVEIKNRRTLVVLGEKNSN